VSDVQQQYVRNTGFNRWAETNHIVVLYPQTSTAATNSC
jgi:poly(3-hydroxybutyrate) depolymerase